MLGVGCARERQDFYRSGKRKHNLRWCYARARGQFIHRMTSPKHEVPKLYEVTTREAVTPVQVERLLAGVVLDDGPDPVRAIACGGMAPNKIQLTLTSGKYHQVKRMLAAVGNHVDGLHRSQIGQLTMPADLLVGQWRWLTPRELVLASTA